MRYQVGMEIKLSSALAAQMLAHAAETPGVEVCGLLFGTVEQVVAIQPTVNVAADPATNFEIDPTALIAAHKAARADGPPLVGCYHSHPNGVGEPSRTDAAAATQSMPIWAIVTKTKISIWRWSGTQFAQVGETPL
jgi:desampylase